LSVCFVWPGRSKAERDVEEDSRADTNAGDDEASRGQNTEATDDPTGGEADGER
jgi:hypothetical protein